MGLTINLEFDSQAQAAPPSFRTALETAAAMLDSAIATPITVNLKVGYGEFGGTTLSNQMGAVGNVDQGQFVSYSKLRADLIANAAPGDASFNSLASGSMIQGQSQVAVWNAELKALGLLAANNTTTDDGSIGIGTAVAQASLVGVALHELVHAMGRVPFAGLSGEPDVFDLFRFTGPGTRLFSESTPSPPAYFSVDGGNTKLADYGESSDPSDFLNPPDSALTPEDPFNEFYDPGTIQSLTTVDLEQLDVLGFGTGLPNSPPPAGTTADMFLRRNDGSYEIYNIGNNAILATFSLAHGGSIGSDFQVAGIGNFSSTDQSDMILRNSAGAFEFYHINANNISSVASMGQVGMEWQVAGFGGVNGDGSTDMMLRNSHTGSFELYNLKNGQIASASSIGQVGLEWRIAGIGDFNGSDTSDMILRDSKTGTFEVYDISNHQLMSAALLGQVGLEWQVPGFGNFAGDGTTDMMLRNSKAGVFEVYDIKNNQITLASALGQVGLEWQVVGFGPLGGAGMSDMILRNTMGAFEVYDISANKIMSAASLGSIGTEWQVAGFAGDSQGQAMAMSPQVDTSHLQLAQAFANDSAGQTISTNAPFSQIAIDRSHLQLVQAMAGFSHGGAVTSPIGLASPDPMAPNAILAAHPLLGGHG